MSYTWKESYEMCSFQVCKHWGADPDGAYCGHPKAFEISSGYGASLNRMNVENLCTGCNDDPSKNKRELFERFEK